MAVDDKIRLTRQTVVAQALALADTDGLEALTIRRLAEQLGVTPMAIYWHVQNKDELLLAMADQLFREVTPTTEPGAPWQVQLRSMLLALLGVVRAHRCAPAVLVSVDQMRTEGCARATDVALDLLSQAGFSLQEAFVVSSYLLFDVIGLVDRQPASCAGLTDAQLSEVHRQKRLLMQALPMDRFPRIVEYAAGPELDGEPYFEFGIDLIMAGIEAMALRRQTAPA